MSQFCPLCNKNDKKINSTNELIKWVKSAFLDCRSCTNYDEIVNNCKIKCINYSHYKRAKVIQLWQIK